MSERADRYVDAGAGEALEGASTTEAARDQAFDVCEWRVIRWSWM
jgi:hypothetical protein